MGEASAEQKAAVECGYWCNWRYDPRLLDAGKNPFHLDSREPKGDFRKFLLGEVRYASLQKLFPQEAEALFEKTEKMPGHADRVTSVCRSLLIWKCRNTKPRQNRDKPGKTKES